MNITNNFGESVRVQVVYRDASVDDITVDDNDTRSLDIKGNIFMEPDECPVGVLVYELGEDTPKEELIIKEGRNAVNVIIKKGKTGPAIYLAK
jgi:hypothetical protein